MATAWERKMKQALLVLITVVAYSNNATGSNLPLIDAIKSSDRETVLSLIQKKSDINTRQADGASALHWAVHNNDQELVELLINAGADVDVADETGATPLWVSAYNGSPEIVAQLIQAGANPDAALRTGETPLMTAAENGNLEVVNILLSADSDVAAVETRRGQSALMWAVAEGHPGVARALIENGADVMQQSFAGYTPLHFASQNNSLDSAKALLSMDADVNETAKDKMSPLLLAAASGYDDLTQYLLELGADPNVSDYRGFTALHYTAMQRSMIKSVQSLLEHGADPNVQIVYNTADHELQPVPDLPFLKSPTRIIVAGTKSGTFPIGATPFYLAGQQRNPSAMRLLARYGADIHMRNTESIYFLGGSGRRVNYIAGTTPLMAAAGMDRVAVNFYEYPQEQEKQALEAVKVAVELGADLNATNEYGMTALHAAAFIGADDILEYLIRNGADPDAMDSFGQTPVSIAMHVVTEGLGNYFDVRPRRSSPSTFSLLMQLGATPLEESGVVVRQGESDSF
jgi:ankyrin repeat protein